MAVALRDGTPIGAGVYERMMTFEQHMKAVRKMGKWITRYGSTRYRCKLCNAGVSCTGKRAKHKLETIHIATDNWFRHLREHHGYKDLEIEIIKMEAGIDADV